MPPDLDRFADTVDDRRGERTRIDPSSSASAAWMAIMRVFPAMTCATPGCDSSMRRSSRLKPGSAASATMRSATNWARFSAGKADVPRTLNSTAPSTTTSTLTSSSASGPCVRTSAAPAAAAQARAKSKEQTDSH